MENDKSFKYNYTYNAKKALQIIEKNSKQDNYNKSEINKRNKVEYGMKNMGQALSEVYDIINNLDVKLYNKIPMSLIKKIKENKDDTYHPQIDFSKDINKQKLLKDTRIILFLIYRKYIYTDEK